jgi:hypothetical protein
VSTDVADRGPLLFARYAYPPNALGYCGPKDPDEFLGLACTGEDATGLRRRAAEFEGAWPYLQLIARCNGIDEPLDARVVEAYWRGNELLGAVPPSTLVSFVEDRFGRRLGSDLQWVVSAVPPGLPHHSFHVFAVYPWLGLLRAGREGPALEVLDRCRIRWGRVEAVSGDLVVVRSRPLAFDGSRLVLGTPRREEVRRGLEGMTMLPGLRAGDVVSLHWDWVCDRLSADGWRWLRHCTRRNLDAVNSLARPGPAVACDV